MGRVMDRVNGWAVLFRFVTPALLGILVWTVQDIKTDMRVIAIDVKALSNDYLHELSEIKDRLGVIEGRNVILNGVRKR